MEMGGGLTQPTTFRFSPAGREGLWWNCGDTKMQCSISVLVLTQSKFITASLDRTGAPMEVASGKPIGLPLRHDSVVAHAVFSPDGSRLATSHLCGRRRATHQLQLWDAATGLALGEPTEAKDEVRVLRFRRSSRHL